MQKPAGISLQLLGKFRVLSGDEPPTAIRISARKSCALLAYLAMHPDRSVGRQQLATLLWADRPDPQARHSLRQCLTSLRADLAPFAPELLRLEGDTVELVLPATAVDAGALAALAGSTELPDLVRARDLYRGAFLADFDLGLETFDEWARAERARLETLAAHAYEACAAGFDALGQGAEAIGTAERLVALDPLREDWQRLALRLCARYRGREAALAKAEDLVARLKSELDVVPSPATAALIEDIRRCGTVSASPVTVAETSDQRLVPSIGQARVPAAAEVIPPGPPSIAQDRRAWARLPVAVALAIATAALFGASELWSVVRGNAAVIETATDHRPGDAVAPGFVSMAVLPFRDREKTGESAVGDRMTRDLIDELARAPQVRVISEQTTRRYRGKTVDVAAVGTELGVRYVVEGTVQLQDDHVRVSVALIDSESRLQVWSDRVERAWSDRSADEDDVARGLARALVMKSVSAEGWRASRQQGDPGVSGLLAQGWAAINRHNATSTTGDATVAFEEVLRRDPGNVTALVGLAAQNVAAVSNFYVVEQEPYLTRAEDYLSQALTRNPDSSGALYWLGVVQKTRGQLPEALRSFATAVKLTPSYSAAYGQMGHIEALLGRAEEGLAHIRYAIELNPQDVAVGRWYMFAGLIELEREHFEPAIEWLSQSVAAMPRNPRAHAALASAYALAGNMADAARQVAEVRKLVPGGSDRIAKLSDERLSGGATTGAPRLVHGWQKALAAS